MVCKNNWIETENGTEMVTMKANEFIWRITHWQTHFICFAMLTVLLSGCSSEDSQVKKMQLAFDEKTQQQPVTDFATAKAVLSDLPKVNYKQLPAAWRQMMDPEKKFAGEMKNKIWYAVKGEEVFRFLAGNYRIMDFIPHDSLFKKNLENPAKGETLYFLLNPAVVERFILLQKTLREKGHDDHAFKVTNGYRYPAFNQSLNAAPYSRHIWGEAIDFDVLDINKNGVADSIDKQIVLELLDKTIIGNLGGVGRYPGTYGLHMDVRGHRARWDSY
jgi:Peptidase M15